MSFLRVRNYEICWYRKQRQTQDELLRKKEYLLNRNLKRIYNLKKQEKTWMFEPGTYELVG